MRYEALVRRIGAGAGSKHDTGWTDAELALPPPLAGPPNRARRAAGPAGMFGVNCVGKVQPDHPGGLSYGPVYLVDEDPAQREAVAEMLCAAGHAVRSYDSAASLLAELGAEGPGCIVSGLVPGSDASVALRREIVARSWVFPIIALMPADDVAAAVLAMKTGAVDVVPRPVQPDGLLEAVRGALGVVNRSLGGVAGRAVQDRLARLTRRERQVLDGMVRGQANKAIAHELGISPRTVEVHRAKVMEKLGCRSLPDIVRLALQAGVGEA